MVGSPSSKLIRDQRGLSTSEYVILLVLLAVVCLLTWRTFGDHLEFGVRSQSTEMLSDD